MSTIEASTKQKRAKRSNDARFPVARIKKLIQADEEVGKVAQATPVLVSKALELFLEQLVQELIKDSQSRHVQKISAHTLKRVINTVPTFDFLSDLVESIPDPIEPNPVEPSVVKSELGKKSLNKGSNTTTTAPKRTKKSVAEPSVMRTLIPGSRSSGRKTKPVAHYDEDYNLGEDEEEEGEEEGKPVLDITEDEKRKEEPGINGGDDDDYDDE